VAALAGVEITSPGDGETVGGEISVNVSYSGTALYPVYYLASGLFGYHWLDSPELSGTHTFLWDTTNIPNGTSKVIYILAVYAGSSSGASDTSAVTIYNPPPVITITSPAEGEVISLETTILPVTVEYHNVQPNYHGIRYISVVTSGGHTFSQNLPDHPASGTHTWDINISGYPLGEHWVQAYCDDTSGKNTSTRVAFTKGIPPSAEIAEDKQVPKDKVTTVAEPINVANGNMFTRAVDIFIPAKEIPLELSRIYNSQDDFEGAFGYGWRCNYDITLEEQPDQSVIEADEDGVYSVYTKNSDSSYTASAGKYSKLIKNDDGTYIIIRKHGRKLYFNPSGRLTKIEGRNNNSLNVSYTASGMLKEVADSSGRKLTFTSDNQGKITRVEDFSQRIFEYNYDSQGNLIKFINPMGSEKRYNYDTEHNLIEQIDENEHSLYFEYDASDRAYHSWQDENNSEVNLTFDSDNKTTTSADSLGRITTYEYNDYGLAVKIIDAQDNISRFSWDEDLNKTSSTDKNGNAINYTYDNTSNLLTITDSNGKTTTFTYEPNYNLLASITDALGGITGYGYDAKGNLLTATDSFSNQIIYTYDIQGQLIQKKDAKDNQTGFAYDSYGNLVTITDALANQTKFSYDIIGNLIQTRDAKGNTMSFIYDSMNRLTEKTYPDQSKITYTYDAVGNLASVADQSNNVTSYLYDEVNRLIQITDALHNNTNYAYDTEGNCRQINDTNNNSTQYLYDSLNRLVKIIDPLANQVTFVYDSTDNLISKTDANGSTANYSYDANNYLTQTIYADGTRVNSQYDALGRITVMTDAIGTTYYTYDALSRLLKVDGPNGNTISYKYDAVGNRIKMINQDNRATTYSYDSLNRIASLTDSQGKTTIYSYDEASNVSQIQYPNNTQADYSFDQLNRLINLANTTSQGKEISSYTYAYNPAGMKTRVSLGDGGRITYDYDSLYRLIKEERRGEIYENDGREDKSKKDKKTKKQEKAYTLQYSYDPAGNRLTQDIKFYKHTGSIKHLPKEGSIKHTYNDCNQLTETRIYNKKGRLKRTVNYTYDSNGNLIKQRRSRKEDDDWEDSKVTQYSYDYENRLIKILKDKDSSKYLYDGLGRRIRTIKDDTATDYLYDNLIPIIETKNNKITTYTRNPNYSGGIGSIISSLKTNEDGKGKELYYHYDGLGSITNLSNPKGKTKANYSYDGFGNLINRKGGKSNPYTFSTKEQDKTGLIYFGARYYDPSIGRFITPDPLGMVDGPNLYTYVNNNPINFIDPWGLCGEKSKSYWDHLRESFYEDLTGKNPSSFLGYTIRAVQQTDILWGQLGRGAVSLTAGISVAAYTASLMEASSGFGAVALYPTFVESIFIAGYGFGEVVGALTGVEVPDLIETTIDMLKELR